MYVNDAQVKRENTHGALVRLAPLSAVFLERFPPPRPPPKHEEDAGVIIMTQLQTHTHTNEGGKQREKRVEKRREKEAGNASEERTSRRERFPFDWKRRSRPRESDWRSLLKRLLNMQKGDWPGQRTSVAPNEPARAPQVVGRTQVEERDAERGRHATRQRSQKRKKRAEKEGGC